MPRITLALAALRPQQTSSAALALIKAGMTRSRTYSAASYSQKHTFSKGEPIEEDEARTSPAVLALANRLKLADIPCATLARTLISDTSSLKYVNNAGLARFGKAMISFYVYEYFMVKYPRLPAAVLKHIVELYTGVAGLATIGSLWGIKNETRSSFDRYLADTSDSKVLGRLAFTNKKVDLEKGITELKTQGTTEKAAMGVFMRALVAAVYAHRGLDGAKEFIYSYLIRPRKLDLVPLLAFSRPTRELALLCLREGLEQPVARLIAESGRYSSTSVFVVGVFSGPQKLGEGQGSSLKEARTRAAVNALQSWYLYSPVNPQVSSAPDYKAPEYVDPGQVVI